MTALLSMLLQSLVIARPQHWDKHLRTLECRVRDKTIGKSGCTPRSVVQGWYSVTPLQSALGLIEQIPPDLPYNEWVRSLVSDHLDLAAKWEEWRALAEKKEE